MSHNTTDISHYSDYGIGSTVLYRLDGGGLTVVKIVRIKSVNGILKYGIKPFEIVTREIRLGNSDIIYVDKKNLYPLTYLFKGRNV